MDTLNRALQHLDGKVIRYVFFCKVLVDIYDSSQVDIFAMILKSIFEPFRLMELWSELTICKWQGVVHAVDVIHKRLLGVFVGTADHIELVLFETIIPDVLILLKVVFVNWVHVLIEYDQKLVIISAVKS